MATTVNEIMENSFVLADGVMEQNREVSVSEVLPNHGGQDYQPMFSEEEVRGTLEKSASTGKFWLDWNKLKSILSYHLKQVLSEYPEAALTSEQQTSTLGETFKELLERLENALHSFDEGPPFTLQRLCEILLSAKSIYPKLSKLYLALEKNLLVTSTLTLSTDSYPPATEQNSNGNYEESGGAQPTPVENGVKEPSVGDRDEIMADVQEAEVGEDMTIDMETVEDIARSSESNRTPTVDSREIIVSCANNDEKSSPYASG